MDGIHLNQRERLAVQLKRLPEADRWRIFMMQQHMLVSHIETVEAGFNKTLAPLVLSPMRGHQIVRANRKAAEVVLQFSDEHDAVAYMIFLDQGIKFELPAAPSLRLSVKTHKLDLTRKPEGVKEVKA